METECIVYFHPPQEQTYKNAAAKRHWWQDAMLRGKEVSPEAAGGFFTLLDCPVPPFYYRQKSWPPKLLSEAMESVLHSARGMADAYLHSQIMTQMSEEFVKRWEPRSETTERLLACMLSACAAECLHRKGEVTVLLGKPEDTEGQMEITERLLWPYLPRINSLLFYYEEVEGSDIWEEMAVHLENYSYEYGLAPRMLPYLTDGEGYRCGRERCGGVILDYCEDARYPRVSREGKVIYVDSVSTPAKERACAGKNGQILYVSPLKYLDTIVKNSYD